MRLEVASAVSISVFLTRDVPFYDEFLTTQRAREPAKAAQRLRENEKIELLWSLILVISSKSSVTLA